VTATDLCFTSATALARLFRARKASPVELVRAVLARIDALNPGLNAYCTVAAESALRAARAAERALTKRATVGPLHGIPVSIKDLTETRGIRTTWGSRIYEHHVPAEDALVVERLRAAGAIVIGKTNTSEFGSGANTYNAVFGPTRNPWNPALTCGGSTGGGAVALATGMGQLAEGSDLGGSLRTPAAFSGVVGFRTSPGLVPVHPTSLAWDTYAVHGPMARTVTDTALMLSVIAGPDPRAPLSYPVDRRDFVRAAQRPTVKGLRIAWSPDLGVCPIDREIRRVTAAAPRIFERLGARVDTAHPDFSGVLDVVLVSRGARQAAAHAQKLPKWRDVMQDNLVKNIEYGLALSGDDIGRCERSRTELWQRVRTFFGKYDAIICPTTSIPPFPVEIPSPTEVNGTPMTSYIEWLLPTYAFSVLGLPAISVPCGFTDAGLPVGLQIVGPWRGETTALRVAAAFEAARPWAHLRPPE
jgi:amidase